jgi:lipoprotein NlpI
MIRAMCVLLFTMILAASSWAGSADDLKAGLGAVQDGKHDDAIAQLTRALQAGDLSTNDQIAADQARAGAYLTKSLVADAFDRRDEARRLRDSAVADYTSALRLKPDDPDLLAQRGQAYYVNGQYEQSVADFDAALRLKPALTTLLQRGTSLRAKGDFDRAMADYTAALGLDPQDTGIDKSDIHSERGFAAFLAGRFDAAAADFQQALTLGVANHTSDVLWMPYQVAWLHIARARAGQNDADELAANSAKINLTEWPGTLAAFFLGKLKAEDIGAAASHGSMGRSRACNMAFFVGEALLAKGDVPGADRNLRQAQSACNIHAISFLAADIELKRLKK